MTKSKKTALIIGVAVLLVAVAVLLALLLPGLKQQDKEPKPTAQVEYTVQVVNAAEAPIADVGVYIYEDETMAELVWYDTTDAGGQMRFTNLASDTYVAVLADVPAGYGVEDFYPITGELTKIVLKAGVVDSDALQNTTLSLGDLMMDFTIVDTDGVEHTLSELLKTKKAVVLNFWFIECQPCNMEFPFMQEAYLQYADDIEILALNPVNTDEAAIAAFKEQLGLTFPVAMVDPAWAELMKVTAYPTTVVIDRYGNISLVHTGMISDTDTFNQIFDYFISDDYEPTAVGSIDQIVSKAEGSAENPEIQGGKSNYTVTVGAGETYYFELIKLTTKVYVTVEGEDPFVVTYDGKEYTSKNGEVTITVTPEGPSVPVSLQITNKSAEERSYEINVINPKGSYANPYTMTLGEFSATTKAGDDQGTYFTYTAKESGTLTVRCLSSSVNKYSFYLYNLTSYIMRNAGNDTEKDDDGYTYVSIQVKKGHKIQFNVAVGWDDSRNIPAGSFKFEASMVEGDGEEEARVELPETIYTVTAQDEDGQPMSGVTVHFKGSLSYTPPVQEQTEGEQTEGEENEDEETEPEVYTQELDQYATTGEDGIASVAGLPGTVEVTVRVPDGYALETTKYTLTEETPGVTIQLKKIVYKDYTLTLTYPDGAPVEEALVIVGSGVAFTDSDGKVTFHLGEDDYTALILGIPEGYVLTQNTYAFGADTAMTVVLGYGPGHETNPIKLSNVLSLQTGPIAAGQKLCYEVSGVEGAVLEVTDETAQVILNGEDLGNGPISVPIGESSGAIDLQIINTGDSENDYAVSFSYPLGSLENPAPMTNAFGNMSFNVDAGDTDGYYWTKDAAGTGTITFSFRSGLSEEENCIVTISCGGQSVTLTSAEDNEVTLPVTDGAPILFHVIAVPDGEGVYGALSFRIRGAAAYEDAPEGVTYSVTVQDADGVAQTGVKVRFLQSGAVVKTVTTDTSGVASAVLTPGSYTVEFEDDAIICDTSALTLTEEAPTATLTISREEDPVEEGKTRYSVTVTDFADNLVGDVVVLFMDDGAPAGYGILDEAGGTVTADLPTGSYNIQLAFLGSQKYYYEPSTAVVTEAAPSLKIQVALPPAAEGEEHYYFGTLTAVELGGTYIAAQADAQTFFMFKPTEQGVYQFTVTDPDAVISYWGQSSYVSGDLSLTLADYTEKSFSKSINTNALGQDVIIGITGTEDTILTVTRTGDATEDIPYEIYEPATPVTEYTVSGTPSFTNVDLTASTDTYTLVYNETDGYYHIGAADGPVMYIQVTFNKEDPDAPLAPRYVHLYEMVGGVGITGTGFKAIFTDEEGNEVRQEYADALLQYGACADKTYGVYPLTEDLKYILQTGGTFQGWWDPENSKGNLLFKDENDALDTSINLELGWLFAGCYIAND